MFASIYDVRELMKSTAFLRDGRRIPVVPGVRHWVERTLVGRMLKEYDVI